MGNVLPITFLRLAPFPWGDGRSQLCTTLCHRSLCITSVSVGKITWCPPISSPGLDGCWLRQLPLTSHVFVRLGVHTPSSPKGVRLAVSNLTMSHIVLVYTVPVADSQVWFDFKIPYQCHFCCEPCRIWIRGPWFESGGKFNTWEC